MSVPMPYVHGGNALGGTPRERLEENYREARVWWRWHAAIQIAAARQGGGWTPNSYVDECKSVVEMADALIAELEGPK